MSFRLEDEYDDEAKYDEYKKEDAFSSAGVLLIAEGRLEKG